ncbi:hypothetical protein FOCC_FOCC015358 [Frankliniella occidentalis]|nr:hypothetical protein FOCC_FOCC015358 [Frankliniella occidentalis]
MQVDSTKKPVAVPSRRVPFAIKKPYQLYLNQLCDQQIIKKCDNAKGYISPVVIVEKSDSSLRICLDAKDLNEALCRPFYEIPTKEDIGMALNNKTYFSVLDLTSGFWHCKLDKQSSELCKFSTPFGIYQFLRLPFGLNVSPEIFQKAVYDLFGDIEGVVLYFDDMLIVAKTEEEHDQIFLKLEVIYKPGKEMHVADALSRDFLPCKPDDEVLITQVHSVINKVVYKSNDIYVQHTKEDPTLSQVIKFHYEGWPKNVKWLEGDVKAFFNLRNELSVDDDLLYFRNRLVIPNSLKNQSLQQLHSGHQGIVKCKSLARETIFWPGINKDIESFVSDCLVCSKFSPAQKKLIMISHDIPNLPYQQVATDILDFHGDYYLVVIDTYSKWIDAIRMPNKTSEAVIDILKFLFAVHGIPCVVLADNNPFKSYKCAEFAKELNFKFVSCSPYYHQSNGLAEKAVSIVKQFLRKCANDPRASLENCLLHYRVTPLSGLNASPAQLLMSRQLRTMLPIKTSRLKPSIVPNVVSKLEKKALTSKMHYDKTAVGTEIEFSPSDYVFVKNPLTSVWEPGIVVEVCSEPRSYMVKTNFSSNIVRRNSTFLKPRNVKAPVRTPVYLLPGYNNVEPANVEIPNLEIPVIPEQPHDNVNNEIPNNNVPLQEVNENLRRWRQQLADRFAQPANQNANRTRTRVVKPPERLNL